MLGLVAISADAAVAVKKAPAKKVMKKAPVKKVVKKAPVVVPAPMPAPVPAPMPAPAPKPIAKPAPKAAAPMMELGARAGMVAGLTGLIGEITVPDTFLAPMLGMSGVSYRVGASYLTGSNTDYPTSGANQTAKIATINLEGVIGIPSDWVGGLDTYATGGVNYIVKADNGGNGGYGLTAGLGIRSGLAGIGLGDLPGKVCLEVGYGAEKVNAPANRTAIKGVNVLVGYSYGF